jgi:hypothetical protein
MFKGKKESSKEKKRQEAVEQWGGLIVNEVEYAVGLNGVSECLTMFTEWEMYYHVDVLKHMYL